MSSALPHEGVYVRLGLSPINGIGVFAIREIAKGTNIFANDTVELVWVPREKLEKLELSDAQRALYQDFGVWREDKVGCPVNFQNLTPGWYLNEPREGDKPNVEVDGELNFRAARDIKEGEELTVRYRTFSPEP